MPTTLNVLIIGAGLGGLTLAQSLRSAGIEFQIHERDKSPWDRPQGYRLHLDGDAINSAREVLSPELRQVFEATSQRTAPYTTILKPDLSVVKRLLTNDDLGKDVWAMHEGKPEHYNVDRATLRQILLAGVQDRIRFGKRLTHFQEIHGGVIAHFDDGSCAEGDVLVGADGIRSAVRAQRAPHAETMNSGAIAIYGRLPIHAIRDSVPEETLGDIFTVAMDERKVFLGMGSVQFPTPPEQAGPSIANVTLQQRDDYLVSIVGGRPEFFSKDLPTMRAASSQELQSIAAETVANWPQATVDLLKSGHPLSFFLVEMYTSVPCALNAPFHSTLLGDAIHGMTPTLGRGANVAMRDGVTLGRALKAVSRGTATLSEALASYESAMLSYGFDVVREAALTGQQRMAQNPLPEIA
ncbi:FAD-dependent oxidoreductase [Burkholderia sp. 22PA0106]|uniref:FAD-dependent oxidoreductase n=1 Tax=Burkholderia sp. 22PA0106 TaxID=3237371 RepID=UPI0039C3DDF2